MSDWTKMRTKAEESVSLAKKTLLQIGKRLKQEGLVVKKSLELLATRRRLKRAYATLGKLVFESHTREIEEISVILSRHETKRLLFKIESLRIEVEIHEKEVEAYKKGVAASS